MSTPLDTNDPIERDPKECAECGHLHFLGPDHGYCECPIPECDCRGQAWAHAAEQAEPVVDRRRELFTRLVEAFERAEASRRDRGDWRYAYGLMDAYVLVSGRDADTVHEDVHQALQARAEVQA